MATQALGHGASEYSIDQVNIAMRGMPFYQDYMRSIGQDPGHPTLTKSQSQQVARLAQQQGFVIDKDIEMDNHGNWNPIGHKFRNTMIVVGIAAAVVAPYAIAAYGGAGGGAAAGGLGVAGVEGGTAGISAGTVGALGTGAMASTAIPALGTAATIGGGAAAGGSSSFLGMTSGDLARYGLTTGGNVVNSILQSRAQGHAFDEQQRLLAEALAYQKEQDAYARQRQSGLDAQDVARYGYTTARDDARYGDTQQEYLSEFDRNENRYAYATDLEASRYADYRHAIAPYLQAGASANDRAASLLGLPAGAPFNPTLTPGPTRKATPRPTLSAPGSGFGGGPAIDRTGQNFDPAYIGKQVDDLYAQYGLQATGPGTGPTDKQYMVNAILREKGWEPYWQTRIPEELRRAGLIH